MKGGERGEGGRAATLSKYTKKRVNSGDECINEQNPKKGGQRGTERGEIHTSPLKEKEPPNSERKERQARQQARGGGGRNNTKKAE